MSRDRVLRLSLKLSHYPCFHPIMTNFERLLPTRFANVPTEPE